MKADSNRMELDNDDQKCFCCVSGRLGDCVNDVGCTKQDVISLSAWQHEFYTWITGKARTIHTHCLHRDCIKRCMTKMEMMIVGAWAGEQLLAISGTGVTIGEYLFEGQSWTMGVVLLRVADIIVRYGHLPTGRTVTGEPEVATQPSRMALRSMRAKIINHVRKRTWSFSRYSGDQLAQL